jgi:hypothetical protein
MNITNLSYFFSNDPNCQELGSVGTVIHGIEQENLSKKLFGKTT